MDLLAALGLGSSPPSSPAQGAVADGGADPSAPASFLRIAGAFGLVFSNDPRAASETLSDNDAIAALVGSGAAQRFFSQEEDAIAPGNKDAQALVSVETSFIAAPSALEGHGAALDPTHDGRSETKPTPDAEPALKPDANPDAQVKREAEASPEPPAIAQRPAARAQADIPAPTILARAIGADEGDPVRPDAQFATQAQEAQVHEKPAPDAPVSAQDKGPRIAGWRGQVESPPIPAQSAYAPPADAIALRERDAHLLRHDADAPLSAPRLETPGGATAPAPASIAPPDASDPFEEESLAVSPRVSATRAFAEAAPAPVAPALQPSLAAPQAAPQDARKAELAADEPPLAPHRLNSEAAAPAALRADSAGAAAPTPASAQVANQVLAAIRSENGLSRIEVRLDPPDLGRVQINFELVRDNTIVAVVSSERGDTLDLLRRHAGDLAAELQRAGFSGVRLEFAAHGERDFARDGNGEASMASAAREGPAPARDIVYLSWRDGARIDRLV